MRRLVLKDDIRLTSFIAFQKDTGIAVQFRNFESVSKNISEGVYIPLRGNILLYLNPLYKWIEILMDLNLKIIDIWKDQT